VLSDFPFPLAKDPNSCRIKNYIYFLPRFQQLPYWDTQAFGSTRKHRIMGISKVEFQNVDDRIDKALKKTERCAEDGSDHKSTANRIIRIGFWSARLACSLDRIPFLDGAFVEPAAMLPRFTKNRLYSFQLWMRYLSFFLGVISNL
jgi:hypothetical protein